MSDLYAYNPNVCDGDACPIDCEHCGKSEEAEEQTDDDISKLLQHVGYTPEQCGYTK